MSTRQIHHLGKNQVPLYFQKQERQNVKLCHMSKMTFGQQHQTSNWTFYNM